MITTPEACANSRGLRSRLSGTKQAAPVGWQQINRKDWNRLTSWTRVYALVKKVPRGRVVTYGQLARTLRLPGGARTAGRAMAACPAGYGIPWHRVVGAGGELLLREPQVWLQRKLLEGEGVLVKEKRVGEFGKREWKFRQVRNSSRAQPRKPRKYFRS